MQHLKACNRANVIYGMAKALGIKCQDSLLLAKRMPMGLLEYLSNFFLVSHLSLVYYYTVSMHGYRFIRFLTVGSCPADYKQWCETMYKLFGTKWSKIHTGPLWSTDQVSQSSVDNSTSRRTVEV